MNDSDHFQDEEAQLSFNIPPTQMIPTLVPGIQPQMIPTSVPGIQPVETFSEIFKREGRCPRCGELGYFDRSLSLICSKHGGYT